MKRALGVAVALLLAVLAGGTVWYLRQAGPVPVEEPDVPDEDAWLDELYSQNPRESEAAAAHVSRLGAKALPAILATLRDPGAERERVKAALKACGLLGPEAAPAIDDVAAKLPEPDVTAEAAIALSFLGRTAFAPLKDSLSSDDPVVRREALRSIGKLKDRAPLDGRAVVPLLIAGMEDEHEGVRAVGATYLGIIHEGPQEAVPALIAGLADPDVEVRRASAGALASFGAEATPAIPALRKAAGDKDETVAREAGRALMNLQK